MHTYNLRSWLLVAFMASLQLHLLQAQEKDFSSGYYYYFGSSILSKNQQLSDEITRFGAYQLPTLATAMGIEMNWFIKKRFGLGYYFQYQLFEAEELAYQSKSDHYEVGFRFIRYLKAWERSQLYLFGDLGLVHKRYGFTDTSLPYNVFTTDSLFGFGVKGYGEKPTVVITQNALALNAGLGFDMFLGSRTPMTLKASMITTPTFPAYKAHDNQRITNLKRYHNLGGVITIGIGLLD